MAESSLLFLGAFPTFRDADEEVEITWTAHLFDITVE